jgi:hypothetical protein
MVLPHKKWKRKKNYIAESSTKCIPFYKHRNTLAVSTQIIYSLLMLKLSKIMFFKEQICEKENENILEY